MYLLFILLSTPPHAKFLVLELTGMDILLEELIGMDILLEELTGIDILLEGLTTIAWVVLA